MDHEGMQGFCIQARSFNHHDGGGGGGCGNNTSGTKCGRWNPTAEQVKVLTDLFKAGLRTPSTDQIQKISSQLSFYGKIESKNVFYWFQNHKARERQKRRRLSRDETTQQRDHNYGKISAPKYFCEINQVSPEPSERVIETLQLFPLSSYDESQFQKLKMFTDDCKENNTPFSYTVGRENDHPPLDLRLSSFL